MDADGNAQPSAEQIAERQQRLFGEKIFGDDEDVEQQINDTLQKISWSKGEEGKECRGTVDRQLY